jgi:hypothetical protein
MGVQRTRRVAKAEDKQLHLSPKSDGNNKRRRTTFVGIEKATPYDGEVIKVNESTSNQSRYSILGKNNKENMKKKKKKKEERI